MAPARFVRVHSHRHWPPEGRSAQSSQLCEGGLAGVSADASARYGRRRPAPGVALLVGRRHGGAPDRSPPAEADDCEELCAELVAEDAVEQRVAGRGRVGHEVDDD